MTDRPDPAHLSLAGRWSLKDETGEHGCEMDLPGDVISALHAAGHIPDPYWGRNEYDLRWIAMREWTVSRTVTLDHADQVLVLSELDTVASVRWNGQPVLEAQNSFVTYRVDLSTVAREGENEVEITFHSNPRVAAEKQEAQPFYVPYHDGNCPIPHGNMLRKVQCDFGWDWNIALAPFGLYGAMRLEPAGRPRVTDVIVTQQHRPGAVTLHLTAEAAHADGKTVTAEICGQKVRGRVAGHQALLSIDITDPDLWWPAGQGPQTLHDLTVSLGDHEVRRRIGLREVELLTTPDEAGARFAFRVNGREVFMKGANWIPADALAGRITEEGTRDLLQSAVDANMNMLRVWGGGRYEPDSFYEACDELGLMIWQDFMFSCNLYPSTPEFLDEVRSEVRENVARLQHHACLALWCGDNELVGALTWFPESIANRDRYLVNYDRLNRCIEAELKATDPQAVWWPSSPCPGVMDFGDSWHEDGSGDMHFWSVWHEGRDFDHYRDVSPRFCSEFGFQSYPSMDVIRRFTEPGDRNIAAPVFESHQKNEGGNARIAETMFRYFRWPERFEDFVWLSQLQQGLAIKTAVTHWRSLRPHCMGTLYWQLNDTWPVCSWASLDHGGGWKLLHHMAKHFYQPVLVTAVPRGDALALVGVNDTGGEVEVSVTAYATKLTGEAREIATGKASVADTAVTLAEIAATELAEDEVLVFGWTGSDGSKAGDIHAPKPFKEYDLPDPRLSHEIAQEDGTWVIRLTADAMAFFVTAEADVPGRFDRNAIHLGPGHTAEIRFTPREGQTPSFTLRDLHSATRAQTEKATA